MPYKLSGLCVINTETGKEIKCHPNKIKARAHLAALRLNVPDAGGSGKKPAQSKATPGKTKPTTATYKKKRMEALRRYLEAGARHSKTDSRYIQEAHDACVKAGAMCGGDE